jgi:hypothetical protein
MSQNSTRNLPEIEYGERELAVVRSFYSHYAKKAIILQICLILCKEVNCLSFERPLLDFLVSLTPICYLLCSQPPSWGIY